MALEDKSFDISEEITEPKIHKGYNGDVRTEKTFNGRVIVKDYTITGVEYNGNELLESVWKYREAIKQVYEVPRLDHASFSTNDKGEVKLHLKEQLVFGLNAHEIIGKNDAVLTEKLLVKIFKPLAEKIGEPIKLSEKFFSSHPLPVFVDSKPEHFIVNKKNKLFYIDFFPPRLRGDGGLVTPNLPQIDIRPIDDASYYYGDFMSVFGRFIRKAAGHNPNVVGTLTEAAVKTVVALDKFSSGLSDSFFDKHLRDSETILAFEESEGSKDLYERLIVIR